MVNGVKDNMAVGLLWIFSNDMIKYIKLTNLFLIIFFFSNYESINFVTLMNETNLEFVKHFVLVIMITLCEKYDLRGILIQRKSLK